VESKLNKQQPFQGFDEVLKPHLDLEYLKLRGKVEEGLRDTFAETCPEVIVPTKSKL